MKEFVVKLHLMDASTVVCPSFIPASFKCMKEIILEKSSLCANGVEKHSDFPVPFRYMEEFLAG
jgi:hypothetical protein